MRAHAQSARARITRRAGVLSRRCREVATIARASRQVERERNSFPYFFIASFATSFNEQSYGKAKANGTIAKNLHLTGSIFSYCLLSFIRLILPYYAHERARRYKTQKKNITIHFKFNERGFSSTIRKIMKALEIRSCSIYYNGKRLELEIEYYKSTIKVYIIDKSKYWSHVDTIRFRRPHKGHVALDTRDYCIHKGYFN